MDIFKDLNEVFEKEIESFNQTFKDIENINTQVKKVISYKYNLTENDYDKICVERKDDNIIYKIFKNNKVILEDCESCKSYKNIFKRD